MICLRLPFKVCSGQTRWVLSSPTTGAHRWFFWLIVTSICASSRRSNLACRLKYQSASFDLNKHLQTKTAVVEVIQTGTNLLFLHNCLLFQLFISFNQFPFQFGYFVEKFLHRRVFDGGSVSQCQWTVFLNSLEVHILSDYPSLLENDKQDIR